MLNRSSSRMLLVALILVLCSTGTLAQISSLFSPLLPDRCPSPPCYCNVDNLDRKMVVCSSGITQLPIAKMDPKTQVRSEGFCFHFEINFTFLGAKHNRTSRPLQYDSFGTNLFRANRTWRTSHYTIETANDWWFDILFGGMFHHLWLATQAAQPKPEQH